MSVSLQIADKRTHCAVSQTAFLEEISHSIGLLTVSWGQNLAFSSHLWLNFSGLFIWQNYFPSQLIPGHLFTSQCCLFGVPLNSCTHWTLDTYIKKLATKIAKYRDFEISYVMQMSNNFHHIDGQNWSKISFFASWIERTKQYKHWATCHSSSCLLCV